MNLAGVNFRCGQLICSRAFGSLQTPRTLAGCVRRQSKTKRIRQNDNMSDAARRSCNCRDIYWGFMIKGLGPRFRWAAGQEK